MASWERLAHVELSGTSATIDSGTFTAKENLKVIVNYISVQDSYAYMRFNGTTGNEYSYRKEANGGTTSTATSQPQIDAYSGHGKNGYDVFNITNVSNKEKLVIGHFVGSGSGADTAPVRRELVGKWDNTSDSITKIVIHQGNGSNVFSAGSYITVFGASDNTITDEKTTLTGGLPIGTRYEEVDTRKIYRSTTVYSSVDSSASSLTDVPFDASTEIGDLTYSGNEITRSSDSYARHGINSNFFFRNSGTQTVECVAQNTGTSSWVTLGLSASKLVDVGVNSDAPNQLEYAIRAADDGRTWIRQSSNNWTQVSDTNDNTTFKITNDRTTVTYYANGSSIGTTTHGTPASTYYIGAFVSQTGTDGSFVFDYSGDITTFKDNGWKERGTA